LGKLGIGGRIILKWIKNKLSVKMWTEFNRFNGSCARGDELSEDFVQCSGSFRVVILLCNLRASFPPYTFHFIPFINSAVVKSKLQELV
jgi:hypothetical protein